MPLGAEHHTTFDRLIYLPCTVPDRKRIAPNQFEEIFSNTLCDDL